MGSSGNDAHTEMPPEDPRRGLALLGRILELEAQVSARDQLFAVAAHELRNPIHAIGLQIGESLRMASERGDRVLADRLRQVERTLQWFLQRCSVMLDLSRMAGGLQNLDLGLVDIREVLRRIEDLYSPQSRLSESPLHIECEGDLVGRWNSLALEQALGNLVSNAIRFGAGSPVLVTAADTGNNVVRVQVTDHGNGIPAFEQEMMNSDFAEMMRNSDVCKGGFGGGLWLARNLLEAHGGYLEVASARGRGATFTTYLPRSSPQVARR